MNQYSLLLTLGGTELCKRDLAMKKKKKRESKQEKKRNFVVVMSRQKPRTDAAGMWQCEMCSRHKRCKAVQSVHYRVKFSCTT